MIEHLGTESPPAGAAVPVDAPSPPANRPPPSRVSPGGALVAPPETPESAWPPSYAHPADSEPLVPSELSVLDGEAIVYRLFDVGYEIDLERALERLASSAPERVRPVRGEARAIQIKNPPITVALGTEEMRIGGIPCVAEVSARIFDFAVVSLRLRVPAPRELPWAAFSAFGNGVDVGTDWSDLLTRHRDALLSRIAPAIERVALSPVTEDYAVFRIRRLVGPGGAAVPAGSLADEDIAPLLLNERRALSAAARGELLPHRFSYYVDDLAILTWDNALIVEPSPEDTDVQYVLEFANAQLLELRVFDALLDAEVPRIHAQVAGARAGLGALFGRRYARLMAGMQRLVADSTELVERVENSLRVTDDVYLARVYSAALEIFRSRPWRSGIDRKLGIIREAYQMLTAESQASRAEALEITIILLIAAEIVIAALAR